MTEHLDLRSLQERVRDDRHATSFPLIVVGAVGFHYASFQLTSWVPVTYGLPLAFVIVWGLQWHHERRHGVGPGRDQALAVAFAVFLGTSLVLSQSWLALVGSRAGDREMLWVFLPTAAGLAAIGVRQSNRPLIAWAGAIAVVCLLAEYLRDSSLQPGWSDVGTQYQTLLPQTVFLAATIAGLVRFRAESTRAA